MLAGTHSNAGRAAAEMMGCSEEGCDDRAVSRGLCRRHYNQKWKKQALPPKRTKAKMVPATMRLDPDDYTALTKLCRISGRPLASLVGEAVREYLVKYASSLPQK